MYREYRELTKADAVTACYRDMASRHRTRARGIHIITVDVVKAKDTRRTNIKQFHVRLRPPCCALARSLPVLLPLCVARAFLLTATHACARHPSTGLEDQVCAAPPCHQGAPEEHLRRREAEHHLLIVPINCCRAETWGRAYVQICDIARR